MAIDHKTWAKMTAAERHASLLRDTGQTRFAKNNRENYDAISAQVYELLVKRVSGPLSFQDAKSLEMLQSVLSDWKAVL